jgi:hypothetical protein
MMDAESTRNMWSNFPVNNKDDCLKLHHVGYLINRVMMHGTTNTKFSEFVTLTVLSYLLQSVVAEHFPYDSVIIMWHKQCMDFLAFSPRWLICICHMYNG